VTTHHDTNDDPTLAWLLGDGPEPEDALRSIEVAPPPALTASTLAAVAAARADETDSQDSQDNVVSIGAPRLGMRRALWAAGGAAMALAAAALLSVETPKQIGDPDVMVARGADVSYAPEVALKMAVRRGPEGEPERLRAGEIYSAGDAFFFRYNVNGEGALHLVRAAHGRVTVLDSRAVSAGEDDLTSDGKPLAWTTEPADGRAVFALVTTPDLDGQDVEAALTATLATLDGAAWLDAEAFCVAAEAAVGGRCDATGVEVAP